MVEEKLPGLSEAIGRILEADPQKLVISSIRSRAGSPADLNEARQEEISAGSDRQARHFEKVTVTPRMIRGTRMYQAEQFTRTQVFHKNMKASELSGYLEELLTFRFRQLDAFCPACDFTLRISKKGKVMTGEHRKAGADAPVSHPDAGSAGTGAATPKTVPGPQLRNQQPQTPSHNRRKKRLIEEGTLVPPLVDMGIFTEDGRVVRSMGDKFRQINRFLEIVDDAIDACGFESLTIVYFGCGKAYLTFILYYYLTYVKKIRATMIGLDLKAEVIADCSRAAEKYGYENLHFEVGDISRYQAKGPIDMVITLHACDTATDYALYNAVSWGSRVILSVPCCQHELNAQIQSDDLSILTKYGIIRERFAALATDAVRASLLEYKGYRTQVLEFVDLSHTPKNLLIRAIRTNVSKKKEQHSLEEAESLIREFHADPTLYRLLTEPQKNG